MVSKRVAEWTRRPSLGSNWRKSAMAPTTEFWADLYALGLAFVCCLGLLWALVTDRL